MVRKRNMKVNLEGDGVKLVTSYNQNSQHGILSFYLERVWKFNLHIKNSIEDGVMPTPSPTAHHSLPRSENTIHL